MPQKTYILFGGLKIHGRYGRISDCVCCLKREGAKDIDFFHDSGMSTLADRLVRDYVSDLEKSAGRLSAAEIEAHKQAGLLVKYWPEFNKYQHGEDWFVVGAGVAENLENWAPEDISEAFGRLTSERKEQEEEK